MYILDLDLFNYIVKNIKLKISVKSFRTKTLTIEHCLQFWIEVVKKDKGLIWDEK